MEKNNVPTLNDVYNQDLMHEILVWIYDLTVRGNSDNF